MAMGLSQAGDDRAVIALWPGQESVETTQIYLEANLRMKEEIQAKTTPPNGEPGRYWPGDGLLAFLQNLWPGLCRVIPRANALRFSMTGLSPTGLQH